MFVVVTIRFSLTELSSNFLTYMLLSIEEQQYQKLYYNLPCELNLMWDRNKIESFSELFINYSYIVSIISQAILKEILYQQKVRLAVCIISQAILKEILYQQRFGWLFVLYPKLC